MTASDLRVRKVILALVLALIASGAKAQEIQSDTDLSQSETVGGSLDAGGTARVFRYRAKISCLQK